MRAARASAGLEIGGSFLRAVRVAPDGTVSRRLEEPTPASGADGVARLRALLQQLGETSSVVGLASAPVIERGRVTKWGSRPDWIGTALDADSLGAATLVVVDDASAAALAEHEASDNSGTTVYVSVGTGVGGGLVTGGRLHLGRNGQAMDLGHLRVPAAGDALCGCGARGCLQSVVNGTVFERGAGEATLGRCAAAMAEAVRAVVTLLDPDRIVVGGGVVDHTPLYERLEAALEPDIAALLHRSTHGRFAGALGAALWAQQNPGTRSRGQRTIAVVNGPNLDQLGRREPEVYGTHTLADLERACYAAAEEVGCGLLTFQSNAESALIEWIWSHASQLDGLVLNPAGLTAHGRALRDAVIGVGLPFVEVHLTNIDSRGPIHRESCFADVALGRVYGFGIHGYGLAIQGLARLESGTD